MIEKKISAQKLAEDLLNKRKSKPIKIQIGFTENPRKRSAQEVASFFQRAADMIKNGDGRIMKVRADFNNMISVNEAAIYLVMNDIMMEKHG